MISDSHQIRYACIAHKSTILAEFNSADSSLLTLAHQCLQQSPSHHTFFSHTARKQTYTFLIEDAFVYFAIFDESVANSDRISYLYRLKDALHDLIRKKKSPAFIPNGNIVKSDENFSHHCFQDVMHQTFHQLLRKDVGLDWLNDSEANLNGYHDDRSRGAASSADLGGSSQGRGSSVPLLTNVGEGLTKKKRVFGENAGEGKDTLMEDKVDLSEDAEVTSREVCHKGDAGGGLYMVTGGKQRAKQIWKMHVWVVLILDLAVCLILFGIWLWVCHGFQCMDA